MLGDLLMEINGQMTSITVEPPVPEGSKVQVEVASEISGSVSGASLETHYVIIRPDGQTGYGEGHALINTADGEAIQVYYPWGMGRATSPGTFTVKGCITFTTVSSDLVQMGKSTQGSIGFVKISQRDCRGKTVGLVP